MGSELSSADRGRIVVKLPITEEGTRAASLLIAGGTRVCLTACHARHQAIIANGVGAECARPPSLCNENQIARTSPASLLLTFDALVLLRIHEVGSNPLCLLSRQIWLRIWAA